MSKTCSTCRWWNRWREVLLTDLLGNQDFVALGYCEPPHTKLWKGLTDEDYTCGEHKERTDDTD